MCDSISVQAFKNQHRTLGHRNLGFRLSEAVAAATARKFVVSSPVEEKRY
jgi:hypothetical protein